MYLQKIFQRTIPMLLLLAVLLSGNISQATEMVEVALRSPSDVAYLLSQGFDVSYVSPGGMADVFLQDQGERAHLEETGLYLRTVHANIEEFFAERYAPRRDDMGGYRTFDEIVDELIELHDQYPDQISDLISIGRTIEDRDIWAVKISDNPEDDEDEPEVLLTGLIHAREVMTAEILFTLMHTLLEGYGEDEYLTELVDEREIWIIPCHNPDGYVFNEEEDPDGGGMWRKNRRDNEDGEFGVDLNRNWGYQWGRDNIGSSNHSYRETYRGPEAFSEPETQAVREFINERHFTSSLYFHSYGNLCLYPWGFENLQAPHRNVFSALGQKLVGDNGYVVGTGWEVLYPTNGDSDDWIYGGTDEHELIYAFTIEIGTRNDNFWPPLNRVPALLDENLPSCLKLIEYADNPERAIPPQAPQNVWYSVGNDGDPVFEWDEDDDESNFPVSWEIRAMLEPDEFTDEVPDENILWDEFGVSVYNFIAHSDPNTFRFNLSSGIATLTFKEPILPPVTLRAWLRMRISFAANFALEVSDDGLSWTGAPGRNTQELVVDDYSHGHVLRSMLTDGYEEFWWDLRQWADRHVYLRFRYYAFDSGGRNDYIYLDDIGPLPTWEFDEIALSDIEDNVVTLRDYYPEDGWVYSVRAYDGEDDVSNWSRLAQEERVVDEFTIPLEAGWSMISSPVAPEQPSMPDVFADLIENDILSIVKNVRGQFFAPRYDFNQLGDWDAHSGYMVSIDEDCDLTFIGQRIPFDTPIPLNQGWNMISYLPRQPMPVEEALAGIEDNLILVKDGEGRFWSIEFDFSNMEDMAEGFGYMLRMDVDDELIYPAQGQRRNLASHTPSKVWRSGQTSSDNHSVIIKSDADFPEGEIIFRDSDGFVAGLVQVLPVDAELGVAVWGEENPGGAGLASGEPLQMFWRESAGEAEIKLDYVTIAGENVWTKDGFSVLEINAGQISSMPSEIGFVSVEPNPFNSMVRLSYVVPDNASAKLTIFNVAGRQIFSTITNNLHAGAHTVAWDADGQSSGTYFARLDIHGESGSSLTTASTVRKLLLVR